MGDSGLRLDGGIAGLEIVKRTLHKPLEAMFKWDFLRLRLCDGGSFGLWGYDGVACCHISLGFASSFLFYFHSRHIFIVRWARSKKHERRTRHMPPPRHAPEQEL